jgi:hypothetical protein
MGRIRTIALLALLSVWPAIPTFAACSVVTFTRGPSYSIATVTGTMTGTTAVDNTCTFPHPITAGGWTYRATGDQNAAVHTITGFHSGAGLTIGVKDIFTEAAAACTAGLICLGQSSLLETMTLTTDSTRALPPGVITFRTVSGNAASTGAFTLTVVAMH